MNNEYKVIENKKFPNERDLYGAVNVRLVNCRFEGAEDGESALKEARSVALEGCYMDLRYPLWHDVGVTLNNVTMTENCRAALWYTEDATITKSHMLGIKALRECKNISIDSSKIVSPEFGWKSHFITISDSEISSEYLFFMATDITLNGVQFKGKYSFQYVENVTIENSVLDTKDAFWHSKNVTVKDSVVKGEYLAWYSKNLTLINCKIIGTQPLCYCKGLKLIDCEMTDCDLSFEYSDVEARVNGHIDSVKNPKSGYVLADSIGEIISTSDSKYHCECEVAEWGKLETWHYCDSQQMADKLFALTEEGIKTATSYLFDESEYFKQESKYSILTNWDGRKKLLVKTTSRIVVSFKDVTARQALKEGEGNFSLKYWRACHKQFFTKELQSLGKTFTEDVKVVCEEFEVVEKL